MSIRVMTIVWDRYPEGGSKLLTMLALADWGGDDGTRIYPSMKSLAGKIRMSERQAIRIVHELVESGYLELLTKQNGGGRKKTNQYRIRLETLSNCHPLVGKTLTDPTETLTNHARNPDTAMSYKPLGTVNRTREEEEQEKAKERRLFVISIITRNGIGVDQKNIHLKPLNLVIDEENETVVDIHSREVFLRFGKKENQDET